MSTRTLCGLLVASISIVVLPVARAELPVLHPVQTLEPSQAEVSPVSAQRVLISSPGTPGLIDPKTFLYDWSGGSLIATHRLGRGFELLISGATTVAGEGGQFNGIGYADVYRLPADLP